jgi:hypothetical protein
MGDWVTSIVNLPNQAHPSYLPMSADMQRQYPAMPQLAGTGGKSVSMLIDTFHRNYDVILLSDASASQALEDVPSNQFHYAFYDFSNSSGFAAGKITRTTGLPQLNKQVH